MVSRGGAKSTDREISMSLTDEAPSPIPMTEYYVLAVITGGEEKFMAHARRMAVPAEGRLIWPRRTLKIRRAGVTMDVTGPLYPGYLFWETRELSDASLTGLKKLPGFIKFLNSNHDIIPLPGRERDSFRELVSDGEVLRISRAVFDENNRIRVIEGPLKRLEGDIVKVDRRRGRARVMLTLQGRTMMADLAFEVLGKV